MKCRSCNHITKNILDFGNHYLAGKFFEFKSDALNANKYPLRLNICAACSLLQIEEVPDAVELFNKNYSYVTGKIPGLVTHFEKYANWISKSFVNISSILEFGCNDGTFLQFLQKKGFITQGMDASENVVNSALNHGLDVKHGFFGTDSLIYHKAQFDLITCSNVYAHAQKITPLTAEAWRILKENGIFLIEVHNAQKLLPDQFDSIYHEHSVYYDLNSITNHLNQNGFNVIESLETDMHGAGLRIVAQKTSQPIFSMPDTSNISLQIFKAQQLKEKIISIQRFIEQKFVDRNVDIYGVAGKAQMFYHTTNLKDYVDRAFDDSDRRQGKFIVGSTQRISPYNEEIGDILLITAWNYAADIVKKVGHNYREIYTLLPTIKKWK